MSSSAPKQSERYNYADLITWPDEERWELDNGVPVLMAPAPTEGHQSIATEIVFQLKTFLKGKPCRAYVAPFDVILGEPGDVPGKESTKLQPDVLVVCDHKKVEPRGVVGAPDLVIEVLSPR